MVLADVAEAIVEGLGAVVIVRGGEGEAFGSGFAREAFRVAHERSGYALAPRGRDYKEVLEQPYGSHRHRANGGHEVNEAQ